MTAADYAAAQEALEETVVLAGEPVEAAWDDELPRAMHARGVAVYEEQVLEELMRDLRRGIGGK